MDKKVIFAVDDLCKYYSAGHGKTITAVDHVSFEVYEGETLGLVGESGCGKTTCGRTAIGLYRKDSGKVYYLGKDVDSFSKSERKKYRKEVQMVFQDPYASLDPKLKVQDIIAEGLDIHHITQDKNARKQRVEELLEQVGLDKTYLNSYANVFSGGQRQRIGIARALAVNPKFIVCDEPISALDVSVQAQIVNLLKKLQRERNISYLFIAHDLAMVKYISDRIAVMYMGSIVEIAEAEELYDHSCHPYTKMLISAIPIPDPDTEEQRKKDEFLDVNLNNEVTSCGCKFADRCKEAKDICYKERPKLKRIASEHFVCCHLHC